MSLHSAESRNHDAQLNSRSFNDPPRGRMHQYINRIGQYVEKHVKVFHIEMTVNNDTFPAYLGFMQKPELKWTALDKVMARMNKLTRWITTLP